MPGKFFDEWTVGETIDHPLRRTVTETDNLLWSTMTHNPQPLHIDAEAAKASEFGRILVNGTFTFSLMVGITVAETTMGMLVANLGYDKLVMPKPVFIGDTLRATSEVTELRDSKSRPERRAGDVETSHAEPTRRSRVRVSADGVATQAGSQMHDAIGAIIEAISERRPAGASPHDAGWRFLFLWLGLLAAGVATFLVLFIFS